MNPEPGAVWIGMAHVLTTPSSVVLEDASGGWVNVLAWADCAATFYRKTHQAMTFYGLDLRSIEDAEPLAARLQRAIVEPSLLARAGEVERSKALRFGTFHTYLESS